jgi:hypothetical protein
LVFVGHARNPTNQLALQWFFERVVPLMSLRLLDEPIKLVGDWGKKFQDYSYEYGMPVLVLGQAAALPNTNASFRPSSSYTVLIIHTIQTLFIHQIASLLSPSNRPVHSAPDQRIPPRI